jgi:hypothetical protein
MLGGHSAKFWIFSSRINLDLLTFLPRVYNSVIKYSTKGFFYELKEIGVHAYGQRYILLKHILVFNKNV